MLCKQLTVNRKHFQEKFGLAKKFIWVFPYHLNRKPERTFWPNEELNVCLLKCIYFNKNKHILQEVKLPDSPQIRAKQQKHHQQQGIKRKQKTKHYDNRIN